ncbi:MAG: glycosyltransferase family protein [Actinomycetota bacterium]|nr:glycosyltransferase family protein [Actinomycetota bacterium]
MIVFGSAVTSPGTYRRYAERGIKLACEPDSQLLPRPAEGSIFRNYNAMMDEVASGEGLEALVLLHQDAEIVDPDFCAKLRAALSNPDVGVVGCVGSIGARSIAWWEGSVTWASFIHRYTELGGGDFPSLTWDEAKKPPYARLGEVDTVDGFVLGLSPWVVRNVRFDESLGQLLHGYDFDFCQQVRAAGRKVLTADFKVIHNHSLELASDLEHWSAAHVAVAEKWDQRLPGLAAGSEDWKHRARRAEAEAAVTRAVAMSTQMKIDARSALGDRELKVLRESLSWRVTAPLRRLKALQRSRTSGG